MQFNANTEQGISVASSLDASNFLSIWAFFFFFQTHKSLCHTELALHKAQVRLAGDPSPSLPSQINQEGQSQQTVFTAHN